jgi:ribosomal protein S18 acetylase RimI-like enzyme
MPLVLEPSWTGRRVSVRRTVADPSRTADVVGDLIRVDANLAVIESRSGPVEVPLAAITHARLVPPSTAEELGLQAVAARSLRPAETERLGGWLLRADHGFTHRANSVLPLRQLGRPLDEALTAAHDWYAARGLPLQLQVPVESRRLLDADLGERGWGFELTTSMLVRRLDAGTGGGERVELSPEPDEAWLELYRGGTGATPEARALLTRHDTVAFASVREAGRTVAVGRGTVDNGWLAVMAVEVDPRHRRAGHARAVLAALEAWGQEHGAARALLSVAAENTAALALYESCGYWHHHDYHYRVEPGD